MKKLLLIICLMFISKSAWSFDVAEYKTWKAVDWLELVEGGQLTDNHTQIPLYGFLDT